VSEAIPDPKRNWKVWRVYGPEITTYWVVVSESTDAAWYGESCPPNTAFEVRGTMMNITKWRAERMLEFFAGSFTDKEGKQR
jgi:hypothetical protein